MSTQGELFSGKWTKNKTRADFTTEEWEELPERVRDKIYSTGHDAKRVEFLYEWMLGMYQHTQTVDAYDLYSEIDWFEMWLNDRVGTDTLLENVSDSDIEDAMESFVQAGFPEDHVEEALAEAVGDQNNWEVDIYEGSQYATYERELTGNIYVDQYNMDYVLEDAPDTPFYAEDVDRAWTAVKDHDRWIADLYKYELDDLRVLLGIDEGSKYASIDIQVEDTNVWLAADPDWDAVTAAMEEILGDMPEIEDPEEDYEEQRIMDLKDGFYVVNLRPRDLREEGAKQGICVGKGQFGYARALRNGEIQILSVRKPNGKRRFTVEVKLVNGRPTQVLQIKGKGNRLPGFDRGKTNRMPVKAHEVEIAKELVEKLGLDPYKVGDLGPGLTALDNNLRKNPRRAYKPRKTFSDPAG